MFAACLDCYSSMLLACCVDDYVAVPPQMPGSVPTQCILLPMRSGDGFVPARLLQGQYGSIRDIKKLG